MSDNTVVEEQLKEDSNKDIDDKKKRKKSLKSTDGKSAKSSSRKSSTVPNVENGESIATEDEVPEESKTDSTKEETADTSPQTNGTSEGNHEVSEVVTKDRTPLSNNSNEVTESPDCRPDVQKSQDKNVTMLREMDFRKLAELKEAFHLFDINRDGYIGKQDLRFTFTSMGKPNVTDEALDQMLSEMSGSAVDFDSFVKQFGYKAVQMDPEEELLAALSKWDYLGNGMISEERLKRDLQVWGDKFSEIEAECALEEAPVYKKDGATMIDYIKFCQNICGLRNVEKTRQIEKEAEAYDQELRSFVK